MFDITFISYSRLHGRKMFLFLCLLFIVKIVRGQELSMVYRSDVNNTQSIIGSVFPTIDPNVVEDISLTTPQLIEKYGYKAETHYVTTDDGYILELHRITGKSGKPSQEKRAVCLLQHGLLCTSASWILAGPNHALGYRLSDENYDVWLSNSRGNMYGCNHTSLNPFGSSKDRHRFWSFSFHEMGIFDLPAVIDYILLQTKIKKLQYIAHSQGTASFYVLASQKPEYNEKIEVMHALAPVAFTTHIISPPIRILAPFIHSAEAIAELLGVDYVIPTAKFLVLSEEIMCREKAPTQEICKSLLFLIGGYESDQLNNTLLPLILGYPSSSSVKQLMHFGQGIRSGHFRQFDYGRIGNMKRYKRLTSPDYELNKIKTPVAMYYAESDWIADIKDVKNLLPLLPNVISDYLVPHTKFNHFDYLYGLDVQRLVYDKLSEMLNATVGQIKHNSVYILNHEPEYD